MRGRIAPSSAALAVVAVLVVLGGGLRAWGPVNPAISTTVSGHGVLDPDGQGSFGGTGSTGDPSAQGGVVDLDPSLREVTLNISNHSRSGVTIERLRVVRAGQEGTLRVATGPLPTVVSVLVDGDPRPGSGAGSDGQLGRSLDPGGSVSLRVRLAVAACDTQDAPALDNSARYAVVADLRTTSGRIKVVGAEHVITASDPTCGLLPPLAEVSGQVRGEQPADPGAARLQIAHAYAVTYDFSQPNQRRIASVDDPSGLESAVGAAASGEFRSAVLQVEARVTAVSFTAPDQAVVAYDLLISGGPTRRIGAATLVDGTWRVSRSTLCKDLEMAQVTCPPIS